VMDGDASFLCPQVIAGESLGAKSPIETRFPLIFLDVRLQPHCKTLLCTP
jgi:hypothetical protein